jgi:hypothetical protein
MRGGHFDPYRDQFPAAEAAATEWFCEHLVGSDARHALLARCLVLPHEGIMHQFRLRAIPGTRPDSTREPPKTSTAAAAAC